MSYITTRDGVEIYYEEVGEGPPIVFIGGFSTDHLLWDSVVPLFATRHKVITFDNRGAGQSSIPDGPYSMEQMAEDVIELCENLNIDNSIFIGNSMGGCILQTILKLKPNLVSKAIVCNSCLVFQTTYRYYLSALHDLIESGASLSAINKVNSCWVFSYEFLSQPGAFEQLIQAQEENSHPFTLEGFRGQCKALENFDSRSWAHQITTPTLVISASEDLIFSEKIVCQIADIIPTSNYYIFKGSGHLPHIEFPEQFVSVVNEFIRSSKIE